VTDSTAATGLTVQQWDDKFFVEHLSENRFAGEMGNNENAIIQVNEDLTAKKGDSITFALVNKLTGAGVENGGTIEGNEEDMDSRSFKLTIKDRGHGVRSNRWENQISAIDLRKAAKVTLKDWSMENTRDRIIDALHSINGVVYGSATEAQKDAWLADNADRVLFGAAKSNNSSNDHSASLANIDNTNDKLTGSALKLLKRMAATANPKIKPVRDMYAKNGRKYYVAYCGSLLFRDLSEDSDVKEAQRQVSLKEENSRLFKGGDLLWDNVIVKEIEDMTSLTGVGAASIDVAPLHLCGAQALGYGVAERWKSAEETFDYGRKKGCAIMEMGGIEKLLFGTGAGDTDDLKDHGVVTGYFAAVADA
jgi:N4-gp56 family major capsid protein